MFLKSVFGFLLEFTWIYKTLSLFEYCDYQIGLNTSVPKMYINSPNYPQKYPSGSSCRFSVTAPHDYILSFTCRIDFDKDNINLSSCSSEQFYFNQQGNDVIEGSEYFCGNGNFIRKSTLNKAVISYVSLSRNLGGLFSCLVQIEEQQCDCGWSSSYKVAGGTEVSINEFPSMAAIIHLTYQRIFCGATIIHRRYLLSAAHCYSSNETMDPNELSALVGDNDITTSLENPFTKLYDIENITYHENYNPDRVTNDIAILRTKQSIDWNLGVGPACLPYKYLITDFSGLQVDTVGFGTTSFGGPQSNVLLKATLDVITNVRCTSQISELNFGQFCTFTAGKDACQFDSGGGLYYRAERLYVIGIVSFGFSCATNFPSVNTKVSTYLFWLQNKLPNVKFCMK